MGIFNESYINELFGFKKKKKTLPPFPKEAYERIMKKYGSKKVQPPTDMYNIDICAYALCKYNVNDLEKFCNQKDTQYVIKQIKSTIRDYEEELERGVDQHKNDLEDARRLLKKIGPSSVCYIVHHQNVHGEYLYFKGLNSIVQPNDYDNSYHDVTLKFFIDDIKYAHKYDFDNIEE